MNTLPLPGGRVARAGRQAREPALPRLVPRLYRYGGVSLIAAALAQAGLALSYGVLGWSSTASVIVSLAVSVLPSYCLNRRYVWPRSQSSSASLAGYLGLAVAGSLVTIVTVYAADAAGSRLTSSRPLLTLIVNATALATTVVVWVFRYWMCDRFLFSSSVLRPASSPVSHPEGVIS